MESLISLTGIFFIALTIFRIYIIIYRKTRKRKKSKKKKKRSLRDEKIA